MKLIVTTATDLIINLDVSPDMDLRTFKALCECEVGFPAQKMIITHNGRTLVNNMKDLSSFGVKEGDVLLIRQTSPNLPDSQPQLPNLGIDFSGIRSPNSPTPSEATTSSLDDAQGASTSTTHENTAERLRQELLNAPDQLALLKKNNPSLAKAFLSGNKEDYAHVLNRQLAEKFERERKRIQMLNADELDRECQKLIAEEIRQINVNSNMEKAIDHHPESFGKVTMLYVDCKVNGHPVKALVDSGGDRTTMNKACAERCGILRLVDENWSAFAKGLTLQKTLGKVHSVPIQINDVFLQSSYSIIADVCADMLLGLDILKYHQCCIDLKRNVLVIGSTGTEVPFVSEESDDKSEIEDKNASADKSEGEDKNASDDKIESEDKNASENDGNDDKRDLKKNNCNIS